MVVLPACAMSGTDVAKGAICIQAGYAMSGDAATIGASADQDAAQGRPSARALRGRYAVSGTEVGYAATRWRTPSRATGSTTVRIALRRS
eukprot:1659091-Rhodomonas_salina.5